ncbi:hypothetical protein CLV78_101250 [Aliiruegeria haliotis]|uniref:ElaB/YqjD/DUF883 family membrane-anchored ribosome-binding protein n=1 Tax=Aliiruegeria haliotis TaxID=1280846 RepID=A0A2T0RY91_9RHOB|nr:hypothetical protein [Aliiruegeria haliotis]PRY26156.1 hypothetical protein CLV78_101250 [Aliiruegeria haliotis]
MATKAELEEELKRLREELAARPDPDTDTDAEADDGGSRKGDAGKESAIDGFLSEHGLAVGDFERLLEQLSEELGALPQNKPVLTALGAFALGFLAGRMSK